MKSPPVVATGPSAHRISSAEGGLVQVLIDADIHSPSGTLSTHSLAMILTQLANTEDGDIQTFPWLKQENLCQLFVDDHIVPVTFIWSEATPMPELPRTVLPADLANT